MDKPVVRDAALLIFRAPLGLLFFAPGGGKMFLGGLVCLLYTNWGHLKSDFFCIIIALPITLESATQIFVF